MSVGPMVAKGQTNFTFLNSNLWVVKDPSLIGTFIETTTEASRAQPQLAQGRKKRISDSVSDLIRKDESQAAPSINASLSTISLKTELVKPRNLSSAKHSKNISSATQPPSMTPGKMNDFTKYYSLNSALLTKPVNMQNGKASHSQKHHKSSYSSKKNRSSNESKKHWASSQCSSMPLSKVHFQFGGQDGSGYPGYKSKRYESRQSNFARSDSPVSRSSFTGRELPPCNKDGFSTGPLRRSLNQSNNAIALKHAKKVFLSEKQSGSMKIEGIDVPCAPPATPTPEQLLQYEYVPSLKDIRAQRAVRQRLQIMEKQEQRRQDRQKEEQAKLDKQMNRQKEIQLKRKQRQEIYALNEMMTALENKRFEEFCKAKGISL
ncbi:protein PRRC2C-like [Gigantopelta aegis]|uniref:protein PRRC2C-like n=1 Tax=Gigantopelta aegis TaxID=1735272 RepID=UPI001B88CF68|nr:protein PRRC2C-like [Gigantopelta aegis]